MPIEKINTISIELNKLCLNQIDNTKKIINVLEKTEKENGERVTRLSNNMASQIISCMLESENKQDNRIKQIVCTVVDHKISDNTGPSYYSHQLSPDLISKLK